MKTDNSCPKLEDFLNGEGSSAYRHEIRQHLEVCSKCNSVVQADEQLLQNLRSAHELIEVPASCTARINELMYPRAARWPSISTQTWKGSGLALAASILLALMWLTHTVDKTKPVATDNPVIKATRDLESEPPHLAQRDVQQTARVTVPDGWLVAKHPDSDGEIEVYIVRPSSHANIYSPSRSKGNMQ